MLTLPLGVVLVVVFVAAGIDLFKFQIPNVLTGPLLLSGLVYQAYVEQVFGLSNSFLGILVGTLPFLVVYAMGGMGAGDLKLMAGVGAWLGPWITLHVIIVSGLTTGCLSAALMIQNRLRSATVNEETTAPISGSPPAEDLRANETEMTRALNLPNRRRHAVPFGPMVALGVIVAALWAE